MKLRNGSALRPGFPRFAFPLFGLGMIALAAPTAHAQVASGVELLSQVPGSGNDCWGYVSPSGREYAIMGTSSGWTVFIEITDPTKAVEVGRITTASCTWTDIKVYKQYAYIVTECGSGIQVIDLGNIDSGVVSLVNTFGPSSNHNVVIDTDSGFLYSTDGPIFDLSDPVNPVQVGTTTRSHDAQLVTYTTGPYAGKHILFACKGGNGLGIYDVTNKVSPVLMAKTTYPMLGYCHQGWLSEDRHYFYVNDEFDEVSNGIPTRTLIFDVSDLSNPVLASTYNAGVLSTDHNLHVKGDFVFEANYTSGLRILDACDPANLVEVGYYDTYPAHNNSGFSGAWSTYPFFPSGTVIVNDRSSGLFVLDVSEALAAGACACYPDCDPNGELNIFDFLCFQDSFVSGEPYACDCDPDPACNIFDFLCFQNAFVGGCN